MIRAASLAVFVALGLGWSPVSGREADAGARTYHGARPGSLAEAKRRLDAGDASVRDAVAALAARADRLLDVTPPSVTDKRHAAPSGDPHDYTSLAPYFWPDRTKPGGLPYVRRDGHRNPEARDEQSGDRSRIGLMASSVETLGLAWTFTREPRYAEKAAEFARTWFLDEATKMTPHLNYAQAVRGSNEGRGAGILEGRELADAVDAIALIADSGALSSADHSAIDDWANAYIDWLLTSDHGHHERDAANNHGTYFDVQLAQLSLATGRRDLAASVLAEAGPRRIAAQVEPDGSQPHELARTRSLGYSAFNLRGLCLLATLGEHAGIDLWHYESADGRSIRRAVDFLLPYMASPPARWPYEQIAEIDPQDFQSILWRAAVVYRDPAYAALLRDRPDDGRLMRLVFVRP